MLALYQTIVALSDHGCAVCVALLALYSVVQSTLCTIWHSLDSMIKWHKGSVTPLALA